MGGIDPEFVQPIGAKRRTCQRTVKMNLDAFINDLRRPTRQSGFLDLDPLREHAYMVEHTFRFRVVHRRLAPIIDEVVKRGGRMLDIGPTPFTLFLKHTWPKLEIVACDRTELLRERFAEQGIALSACDLDEAKLPYPDESIDLVLFTEVMEHVFAPPSAVLGEVRRILRPDGYLLLSVPNIAALHKRLLMLLGRSPLPNADDQLKKDWVHGHGHVHEYTLRELRAILPRVGFTMLEQRYLSHTPIDMLKNVRLGPGSRLFRAVYTCAQRLAPSFGTQIQILARKSSPAH
jgi:SAM-dependent methyltransferase